MSTCRVQSSNQAATLSIAQKFLKWSCSARIARISSSFSPFVSYPLSSRTRAAPFRRPSGRVIVWGCPFQTVSLILGCFLRDLCSSWKQSKHFPQMQCGHSCGQSTKSGATPVMVDISTCCMKRSLFQYPSRCSPISRADFSIYSSRDNYLEKIEGSQHQSTEIH